MTSSVPIEVVVDVEADLNSYWHNHWHCRFHLVHYTHLHSENVEGSWKSDREVLAFHDGISSSSSDSLSSEGKR